MHKDTEHELAEDDIAEGAQIGDYLVGRLLSRGASTMTWAATQISVQREVVICNLFGKHRRDSALTTAFMEDVRVKATVDHPLISSVLEAIYDGGQCFFACEKLHGKSLQEHYEDGISIPPVHLARIVRSVAAASMNLEAQGIATLPLEAHDLMLDDKFHCRLVNVAVSGEPSPGVATGDKKLLGQLFHDMLPPGQPGATRVGSLLQYMREGHNGAPLSWEQIHNLADSVERQLTEPRDSDKINSPTVPMRPFITSAALAKIGVAVACLATVIGLVYHFSNRKSPPPERRMADLVHIPDGSYPGPLGMPVHLSNFALDAHEVTIGEYAKFLNALKVIPGPQRTVYQHEEQPEDKTDHLPDDWENLYRAATAGGTWNGMPVDLNYPVVGVDWWDAYAYAEWKGRRLPTREEWYASCSAGADPAELAGTGWMPVDRAEKTSLGLFGMAGNVSEWTLKPGFNPADPSQPARYIICGASYLKPKFGARAREWVSGRGERRPDLGFRTCSVPPENKTP